MQSFKGYFPHAKCTLCHLDLKGVVLIKCQVDLSRIDLLIMDPRLNVVKCLIIDTKIVRIDDCILQGYFFRATQAW